MNKFIGKFFLFLMFGGVMVFGFNFVGHAKSKDVLYEFYDVVAGSPFYESTLYLKNLGLISGYSDGTFKPEKIVNRAEALKMIMGINRFKAWDMGPGELPVGRGNVLLKFKDIQKDAWYIPYLKDAVSDGFIKGYSDGTFRPEQQVNLAENLKMLMEHTFLRFADKGFMIGDESSLYSDTPDGQWFSEYFAGAKAMNLLETDSKERVFPAQGMTRGKLANLIYRALVVDETGLEKFPEVKFIYEDNGSVGKILINGKLEKEIDFGNEDRDLKLLKFLDSEKGQIVIQNCLSGLGGYILYGFCDGETWIFNVKNGEWFNLGLKNVMDVSRDGELVVYSDDEKNHLIVKDVVKNVIKYVIEVPDKYTQFGDAVFSRDARKLAYGVAVGDPNNEMSKIMVYDLDSEKSVELVSKKDKICRPLGSLMEDESSFAYNCE